MGYVKLNKTQCIEMRSRGINRLMGVFHTPLERSTLEANNSHAKHNCRIDQHLHAIRGEEQSVAPSLRSWFGPDDLENLLNSGGHIRSIAAHVDVGTLLQ